MNNQLKLKQINVTDYVLNGLKYLGAAIANSQKMDNPCDNSASHFENSTFIMKGYSWDDEDDNDFNFKYNDFEVVWYKYIGRGTYQNQEISFAEWDEMFQKCLNSLKK